MWSRIDLKFRGKSAFRKNYGRCVLVALILMLLLADGSSSGSGVNNRNQNDSSGNYSVSIGDNQIHYSLPFGLNQNVEFSASNIVGNIFQAIWWFVSTGFMLVIAVVVLFFGILVSNPMEVGGCRFFVENASVSQDPTGVGEILFSFKSGYYGKTVVTMLLRNLYIFLWGLLFIIPGIIKSYEYRMIPYLLADAPDLSREEAFKISKELMDGQKMNAFVLDLSFIGWKLLSACTCGLLGIFYVNPYQHATNAELFLELKREYFGQR